MSKGLQSSTSSVSFRRTKSSKDESSSRFGIDSRVPSLFFEELVLNWDYSNGDLPTIFVEDQRLTESNDNLPTLTISPMEEETILLLCKGNKINANILNSFSIVINSFNNLTDLKLEFCGLEDDHIDIISDILLDYEQIHLLSLNGNPLPKQSFYKVLEGNTLRVLSLQLCKIDEIGAELLSKELLIQEDSNLIYLNLGCNYLTNDGLYHITKILRGNRTLYGLNIADNSIDDDGFLDLFDVFCKFPLEHEEIVFRRRKNMEYLLKKEAIIKSYKLNNIPKTKKESTIKKKKSAELLTKRATASSVAGSMSASSRKSIDMEIELELCKSTHPFVCESEPENKEIFCIGNNSLAHLNISYNRIGDATLEKILDTIAYQKKTFNFDDTDRTGLTTIITANYETCEYQDLVDEINNLLTSSPQSKSLTKSESPSVTRRNSFEI